MVKLNTTFQLPLIEINEIVHPLVLTIFVIDHQFKSSHNEISSQGYGVPCKVGNAHTQLVDDGGVVSSTIVSLQAKLTFQAASLVHTLRVFVLSHDEIFADVGFVDDHEPQLGVDDEVSDTYHSVTHTSSVSHVILIDTDVELVYVAQEFIVNDGVAGFVTSSARVVTLKLSLNVQIVNVPFVTVE